MGVGLLAPVPSLHLEDALSTCLEHGKVAFGSRNTDVFEKLKQEFQIAGIPVYIYASTHHGPPYHYAQAGKVSLQAVLYNVQAANSQGKHPDPRYRPASTFPNEATGLEIWWCFWEVMHLRVIPPDDRIPLTKFAALGQKKPLPPGSPPKGPMIVKGSFIPDPIA